MIATAIIEEVRRMLREGILSQRQIAERLGVSRGTVNAVALGKRTARSQADANGNEPFIPPTGLPVRCPGCGGRVQMPCLLCHLRQQIRRPTELIRRAEGSGFASIATGPRG